MKLKKVFGALAVLLALTAVACNGASGGNASGSSRKPTQSSSQLPAITITAADNKTTLNIGETVQLTPSVDGVTWESGNTKVATVENGLVTAIAKGSASITAKKDGFRNGSISITVTRPAGPHPTELAWPEQCPTPIDTSAWTAGTAAKNLYGKDYTPLTGTDGSVGVKIAMTDFDPSGTGSYESDGSIATKNESTSYVKYNVKAPKAGIYQMILKASISSSNTDRTFSSRGFDVKVNDYDDQANVYGDRVASDAGLNSSEKNYFVFALVQLSGPEYEDEIAFRNHNYRLRFDTSVDLVFAENK